MKISIVGGDIRNFYLKNILEKEGHEIDLFGFENLENKEKKEFKLNDIIISGIPFLQNNNIFTTHGDEINFANFLNSISERTILIAGNIPNISCKKIDLLQDEIFLKKNAHLTAEGVLQLSLKETDFSLIGANVMIIGFGRIGSILAKMFNNLFANVTVVVHLCEDFRESTNKGYFTVRYKEINNYINKMDIIINTPTGDIITENNLNHINKESLIIDVSSKPHGVCSNTKNVAKIIWASGLPAKIAPKTGALYIRESISIL
ncbi:MAG: hypothetical protein FWF57_00805 [Defluviitaleaceae bacterium]|nr:hypothetical protein [Defluviitaleaceae bacterium]